MKYYQLNLERWITDDWTGMVWRSKLYKSEKDCHKGCAEDEIWNIAEAVWSFWDQEAEPPPLSEWGDFAEIIDHYESLHGAHSGVDYSFEEFIDEVDDFIGNIKKWISKGHSAGNYRISGISADFVEHEVAE